MKNMKNSILEEPLIHLDHLDKKCVVVNEEDDEAKRRSNECISGDSHLEWPSKII